MFGACDQFADPSAQPQSLGGLGLYLADDLAVVAAGEDVLGEGHGLGRALGPRQHQQTAQAQLEPFGLDWTDRLEGQLGQLSSVVGADGHQQFCGRYQDVRGCQVAWHGRRAGVPGGYERIAAGQIVAGEGAVESG